MLPNEDPFLDDIYPRINPVLEHETKKEFKSWHRPRKQYIRTRQWGVHIKLLIDILGYGEGDVLRYLGLPGEDFLDIRSLHQVFADAKVRLKYCGFSGANAIGDNEYEMHLSKHEVSNLEFVDPHSLVFRDPVEQVALEGSAAHVKSSRQGPFDVINLDFCDSATESDVVDQAYLEVLRRLCELQITGRSGRTAPWLLFLTTRAAREQIDLVTKNKLVDCVLENAKHNSGFAQILRRVWSIDEGALKNELSGTYQLTHTMLFNIFGLGLGKWLLGLMMSAHPKFRVTLLDCCSYRISNADPDMLSMAILFTPIVEPRIDRTGLTQPSSSSIYVPEANTEVELATKILLSIQHIKDVDTALSGDSKLNHDMVSACGDLLAAARYDRTGYDAWTKANAAPASVTNQSDVTA